MEISVLISNFFSISFPTYIPHIFPPITDTVYIVLPRIHLNHAAPGWMIRDEDEGEDVSEGLAC